MSKPIGLDFNNRITYLESNKADKTIKILDITDLVNLSSRDYTTYIIGSILPTNSPPGGTAWSLLEYIPINIDYAKLVWTNFGSAIETRGKSFEAVLDITNKIFLYAWKPIIKKEDLEQKADKDKIISASNKIYQIGEIQNYIVTTTFELNCFLSGFYLDGNDNNAFTSGVLSIAKRNAVSVSTIKGTLNILQINNATSPYKCKIQITDKGKIYTISDSYMNFARLMVLTKTDNIVIYNSPILSSIDGNVIWDSELNEANIATNIDLEQKADKQWMVDGWKTETALPNDYPDGTTYFNSGSSAFNALGYVVIKTVKKTGMVKQTIFRDYATAKGEYVRYNKTYDNKSPDYNKWTPWEKIATTDKLDTLWSGNVSLSTTPQTITVSQDLTNYNYLLISHGSGVSTSGGVSEGTSAGEFILRPLNIEDFANGVNMYTYIHGVKVVLQRISATTISIWSSANLSLFRRIKGVKIGG